MRGTRKWAFWVLAALLTVPLCGCGSNRSSDGSQTAAQTPEEILRATSFVGADRCSGCHTTIHDGWLQTAHTQKLRDGSMEVNYINDDNDSGRADFFDAGLFVEDVYNVLGINITDLPGGGAFATYGDDAPVLGSAGGQAYIAIAGKKYDVVYTLGGSATVSADWADALANGGNEDGLILNDEAQWKQRYITKIGNSHYILPVQFNAKTGEYTTYDASKWYDVLTPKEPDLTADSYERRCAGCHVTGLQVAREGDQWTMEFSDISVACEACHGPGGRHATVPSKENIINPATLVSLFDLDGDGDIDTVDDLQMRNNVCYHCHSRGGGKYSSGGSSLAYSSKAGANGEAQMYIPGLPWDEDYYSISTTGTDYWGGDPTSGDFVTSASHHQQQQDHAFGPHGADEEEDRPCFSCHDLHFADKEHLVAGELERSGITVDNGAGQEPNTVLCLNCHTGGVDHYIPEEFQSLTVFDYKDGPEALSGAAELAIEAHMDAWAYMPAGVDTVRDCNDCHMPDTAKSALEGDIKSHTFDIIWPNYVMQPVTFSWNGIHPSPANPDEWPTTKFQKWWESNEDIVDPDDGTDPFATVGFMPNSCITTDCHTPEGPDDIVTQWYRSGHADGFGPPFNHWNTDGAVSSSCSKCHTQGGYVQFVEGDTVTAQSEVFPKVLGCETCHVEGGGGQTFFEAGLVEDVKFPNGAVLSLGDDSNMCMVCHQGRASGLTLKTRLETGNFGFVNRHYLAASAILFGKEANAGFQYRGDADYVGRNTFPGHEGTLDTCVSCHMREGEPNHLFVPDIDRCDDCHLGIADFNDIGLPVGPNVDYDGDGVGESFQDEIDGVNAALYAEIKRYAAEVIGEPMVGAPIVYSKEDYPYFFYDNGLGGGIAGDGEVNGDEATRANGYASFDDTLLPAAYNYHSNQDPCSDNHNYKYVLQVAYDSLDDLDDGLQNDSVEGGIVRP